MLIFLAIFGFISSAFSGDVERCQFLQLELARDSKLASSSEAHYEWIANYGKFKLTLYGKEIKPVEGKYVHIELSQVEVTNSETSAKCNLEVDDSGITRAIYVIPANNRLFVPQSYGTGDAIRIFDLSTCKKAHIQLKNLDGRFVTFSGGSLFSNGICESKNVNDNKCNCYSAQVYNLNDKCELAFDKNASRNQTRKDLGFESAREVKCHLDSQSRKFIPDVAH
jgi:hypothetical protein